MDKLVYIKTLVTETKELVTVATYDNDRDIIIRSIDDEKDCAIVTLTLKEAQRVKRCLEDAVKTHIMNWGEE